MKDQPQKQDLREISHLFLSSVRDRQTGKCARPQRVAPRRADQSIELTPEELAQVSSSANDSTNDGEGQSESMAFHATCLIAAHLGVAVRERIRSYASRFCTADSPRVGLIEVDTSEIRASILDEGDTATTPISASSFDASRIAAALDELSSDVRTWIIAIANPRAPEARNVFAAANRLTVLATADADGTVAAYRAIKGVYDALRSDTAQLPKLSLAVVDSAPAAASVVATKLATVTRQFLAWPIEVESPSVSSPHATEHAIFHARAVCPAGQPAAHWRLLTDFVARGGAGRDVLAFVEEQDFPVAEEIEEAFEAAEAAPAVVAPFLREDDEVIDLPTGHVDGDSVLSAVLAGHAARWVACPITPPGEQIGAIRLAVARDRSLCLLAVAGRGLADLARIANAYEWACQNRNLIAMALPQFAIDAHALPTLALLIDHADAAADELRPIVATGHVSIMTYRKLRWSGRTGLLLAAA